MSVAFYKDLVVWQKSFQLAKETYHFAQSLPPVERSGLSSQIQRCAVSTPSDIAEGQQRHNAKEYRQSMGVARGPAGELETQLLLVRKIYNLKIEQPLSFLVEVQKMLHALTKN